jgi:selenocysteine-specific elongation factor
MTRFVAGVIGHVDHGKTALVRALTGTETDRLPEEKRRGISIALGFAHLEVAPGLEVDLIDMPGHERFVRTMIAGATGIDAVLLIVGANEGVMPQTVEHVEIAGLLGLKRAVVAITKADLVAPEIAARVSADALALLGRCNLDANAPVLTSTTTGRGITELRSALAALSADHPTRDANGLPFLPIDRAFSMAGHGPVVTGTLRGAALDGGETLELLPAGRKVRIRAMQVHGERVKSALPGQRVALNLRDVELGELGRGMALALPGTLPLSDWLTIAIRAVDGSPPLKNGQKLRALLGTDEIDVRLRLLDREVLEPGESGIAQLNCARPVALPVGEHVILRLISPQHTVAGGQVIEVATRRHKRHSSPLLQRLKQLCTLSRDALLIAEVDCAGPAGTSLRHLSQLTALAPAKVAEMLAVHPVSVTKSGLVIQQSAMDALLARIPQLLAPQAEGLGHDRLLAALPGTGDAVLDEALALLLASGAITRRGAQLLIPRPEEDRARALGEAALAGQIAKMLRQAGLTPPLPRTIVVDAASKRAIDRLLREGVIVRAVDRAKGKELLFHQDAIDEACGRLAPLLEAGPGLLVTEIAAELGISRKFTMPLLDHLDTIRFTRRIGDRRLRGPAKPQPE